MADFYNQKTQLSFRRHLRNEMSEPERILWSALRGKQLSGHKFRRQYGVGPYVLDFYCVSERLAIELDGDSHFDPNGQEHDQTRDTFLVSKGITILRFTNLEIRESFEGVLEVIARNLMNRTTPSDSPL